MSYARDYRWDVFVSYGRGDNDPGHKGWRSWISEIVDDLRGAIESYLGVEIAVFMDLLETATSGPLDQIEEAINGSATMVVFAHPAYSKSRWAVADLEAFTTSHDPGRLFVVKLLPAAEEDTLPAPWGELVGWQFHTRDGMPLRRNTKQYHERIFELANSLQRELRAIKRGDARADPLPPVVPSKPRIFLSYSSKDRDRIRPLAERLEQAGLDLWWDPHIEIGTSFRKVITNQLEKADFILVAWSRHSIESEWVCDEAEFGKRKGILIPVLIDPVEPPMGFRSYQTLDISPWVEAGEGRAIEPLLRRLASLKRAGANS